MKQSVYEFNIMPYLQQKILPEVSVPRPPGSIWLVRRAPPGTEDKVKWVKVRQGDAIRIYFLPMKTHANYRSVALALLQLTSKFLSDLPCRPEQIAEVNWYLGSQLEVVGDEIRIWLGAAVKTQNYNG